VVGSGKFEKDGEVQRGAEEEESSISREEESDSWRPFLWQTQDQAPAPLYLWQTQAQALEKMAQGTTTFSLYLSL
jgi:gentisate 1,2-dioxygenase